MVYRIYVEKKPSEALEGAALLSDLRGIYKLSRLTGLRVVNRYDVENIDAELFERAVRTVFSEPQVDITSTEFSVDNSVKATGKVAGTRHILAVESLPGQFDQRADSAAQCIQILSAGERPAVRAAKIYILDGELTENDLTAIKRVLINPVECREAALELPSTLAASFAIPDSVETLVGFIGADGQALNAMIERYGLAMDLSDITFCRDYFISERRDPTLTELRMIDTYWSDHCRHTTFLTSLDNVGFADPTLKKAWARYLNTRKALGREKKPITLMDLATVSMKYLRKIGKLEALDESEEINACTVKIKVSVDGAAQDWLLLFKNETHNHPTEIEPFGGAATCIGGAIRDPLSGRAYVYGAMRVTGAADPTVPVEQTLRGKLPQRKIVTTAAAGYSSYGNQIGLATGQVDEIYHPGYAAKRMEIGAVIAAAPEANVRREIPDPGDVVILLGGRTGRDGIGGATGSSKSHTVASLNNCGAEVQKGNAPEERKLQRLFRNLEASRLIKRCNDFGAGGVSVAIGELADGVEINLDAIPKKYEGLDGTELAISESQERMAVVVAPGDAARFMEIAAMENLEATRVAVVTKTPRLRMNWKGNIVVDISREFLNSNGAEKHIDLQNSADPGKSAEGYKNGEVFGGNDGFVRTYKNYAALLNLCAKRGLSERFDSTIGAGTVIMPFGGAHQLTPSQAMVHKISAERGEVSTVSYMAWGYNPNITSENPYRGAYLAVVESVSKLIAAGADLENVYLTFQEYFERLRKDPARWGKPIAALLGAMEAQLDLNIASIGGKDSMSGSFEALDVPPTLVSFAVATGDIRRVCSPEFKHAGHEVILVTPKYDDERGVPKTESLAAVFRYVSKLLKTKEAVSAWTLGMGGLPEAIIKMAIGNNIGFKFEDGVNPYFSATGGFVVELNHGRRADKVLADKSEYILAHKLGETVSNAAVSWKGERAELSELLALHEGTLENIFPCNIKTTLWNIPNVTYNAQNPHKYGGISLGKAAPRVLIPVFPGTNTEYDSARAFERVGANCEIFVIRNLNGAAINESISALAKKIKQSQIIYIPGGFSGGDEPDGSAKFITALFRNAAVKDAATELLEVRDGLMLGICNGFQALIKLGLVPYGKIIDTDGNSPTLTYNTIGRHQSRIVHTRICSKLSPWLVGATLGGVYNVPISHGEGRFLCSDALLAELIKNGQIATQYCGLDGNATGDIRFNPNGSVCAVEGITSPDGRVFGKMGHSERVGAGLYQNVPGNYDSGIFENGVRYFR